MSMHSSSVELSRRFNTTWRRGRLEIG